MTEDSKLVDEAINEIDGMLNGTASKTINILQTKPKMPFNNRKTARYKKHNRTASICGIIICIFAVIISYPIQQHYDYIPQVAISLGISIPSIAIIVIAYAYKEDKYDEIAFHVAEDALGMKCERVEGVSTALTFLGHKVESKSIVDDRLSTHDHVLVDDSVLVRLCKVVSNMTIRDTLDIADKHDVPYVCIVVLAYSRNDVTKKAKQEAKKYESVSIVDYSDILRTVYENIEPDSDSD